MNFLKNLTGGGSSNPAAAGGGGGAAGGGSMTGMLGGMAKSLGLDPKVIMMKIFQYFAGNLMGTGPNQQPAMDLSGLQKMANSTKITDQNLTDNDITDIFNKVKGKADTIDFDGFQDSLKEMAKKKYQDETKDANKALKKLEDQIIDNAQDFIGD